MKEWETKLNEACFRKMGRSVVCGERTLGPQTNLGQPESVGTDQQEMIVSSSRRNMRAESTDMDCCYLPAHIPFLTNGD